MDPVTRRKLMVADHALGDLAFMVGKHQIHSTAMDVELSPEIFGAHRRAFDMPAGKTVTPGTVPAHDMTVGSPFPQREVGGISLLLLPFQVARGFQQFVD